MGEARNIGRGGGARREGAPHLSRGRGLPRRPGSQIGCHPDKVQEPGRERRAVSEESRPDPGLERLFEEAIRTVEKQIRVGESVDGKAADLLRFEALLLGILLTGTSLALRTGIVPRIPLWLTGFFVVAFGLLVASTLLAIRSYEVREVHLGVHADDLVGARVEEAEEEEILDASLRGYAHGIRRNGASLDAAAERLDASVRVLWLGLLALSVATGILMVLGVAT